jgi:CSLREA domain-containing protein
VSLLVNGAIAASAHSSVTAGSPHIVLLTAADAPVLQALGARYATMSGALDADEAVVRATLRSAVALAADLGGVDAAAIKQSRWFQIAHEQNVPIVLAHAGPAQMTAVTGVGYGGDLVVLRSSGAGRRVGVHVLAPAGGLAAVAAPQTLAVDAAATADALAARVVALLAGAPTAGDTPPVPQPDGLPARAARVWDIETQSPRLYLPDPYHFPIKGASQVFLDDVRFSVGLYSAGGNDEKKYVVIATSGGAGVSAAVDGSVLAFNSDTDRGYYLESYDVTIGPKDQNQTLLQIEKRAPETVNQDSSFSTTTGFTIGLDSGGINAGYDAQNTAMIALKDFTPKLFSTATQVRWSYALSSVSGGQPYTSPEDLIVQLFPDFRIPRLHTLPPLASGQVLNPHNQVVYSVKGTPNGQGGVNPFQGTIVFRVAHQALFRRVQIEPGTVNAQISSVQGPAESAEFPVDFSLVNYHGDVRVGNDDIAIVQDDTLPAGTAWLTALIHADLADYDDVGVSFYNGLTSSSPLIGKTRVNIATMGGAGQRTGQTLARVPWKIAGLPGTQEITVEVASPDGERNEGNNVVIRNLNITAPRLVLTKTAFALAEGGPSDSYQASLSTRPASDVAINFAGDGFATVTPQQLVFTPDNWNAPHAVTIGAVDDDIVEGTHASQISITVTTSDPDYGRIGVAPLSATIADNDNASPSALKALRGGARASYQFALNRRPAATVSISITADGQLALTPSSLTFTPASWDTPQTVVVAALDNGARGDTSSVIRHRASSADQSYSGVQLAAVTVMVRDGNNPATVINVTTSADEFGSDGQCSLREAVEAANANGTVNDCVTAPASYHVINLNAAGPYDLSYAPRPAFPWISELDVTSEIVLNGKGQTIRNRNATGASRHFYVHGAGDLTLSDITLRDGKAAGGGAIFVDSGATVNLVRSTITHNATLQDTAGGGIVNNGTLNILDSAITDNSALNANVINQHGGGAIFNDGRLNVANTTISGNRATMGGGGIDNYLGVARLTNVTITGNTADSDNDGVGDGGGLLVGHAITIIKGSIIAGNFDTPDNAGQNPTAPDIARRANIVAGNQFFNGQIFSAGNNLIGSVGAFTFANNAAGDRFGDPLGTTTANLGATRATAPIDPQLGGATSGAPGGDTVLPLQPASPAVDSIAATECSYLSGGANPLFIQGAPLDHDQRGDPRPHGFRCDSGAYELAQPGVDITVTALDVPTGQFGSVYAIVLKTRPSSVVTIDLTTDGTTTASPSQLVFAPENWNVPQRVTVVARRPAAVTAAGVRLAGAPAASIIHHRVISADPAYSGASLPDLQATIVTYGSQQQYLAYLPLVQR